MLQRNFLHVHSSSFFVPFVQDRERRIDGSDHRSGVKGSSPELLPLSEESLSAIEARVIERTPDFFE